MIPSAAPSTSNYARDTINLIGNICIFPSSFRAIICPSSCMQLPLPTYADDNRGIPIGHTAS